MLNFGQNLKNIRIKKNITREELGKLMEVKSTTIRDYEQNINKTNSDKIYRLKNILQCTYDELFKESEEDI